MLRGVSLIIPVYNAEKTLSRCIESILRNSFEQLELILINDGSQDDSLDIMRRYHDRHPEIIRIFSQQNRGVAKTRNLGISYAKHEYVMFIDNDDFIDRDYIQQHFTVGLRAGADIVMSGYRRVGPEDAMLHELRLHEGEWSKYMIMAPWAKLYRRAFLIENNLRFLDNNIGEDVYFNLQAINATENITIIDYCGYNWFYNEDSVSNSKQKNTKNELNFIYLLDSSYSKLKLLNVLDAPEVEYFFIRYGVWYILFSGRLSKHEQVHDEYRKFFDWLTDKFPEYIKNPLVGVFSPREESLKNRLIVYCFILLHRFKLIAFFLKIYSK